MDPKTLFASALVAAAISGLVVALGTRPEPSDSARAVERDPVQAPGEQRPAFGPNEELLHRIADLEARALELEYRLVAAEDRRSPVALSPAADQSALGAAALNGTAEPRELVLSVLAEEREREAREREEQRDRWMETANNERALRLAERLELNPADKDALVALLDEEFQRGREYLANLGRDASREDRQAAMDALRGVRDWTRTQLDLRFAPDTAARLAENLRGGGFGFDGGRGGRGDRGDRGGQAANPGD